MPDETMFLLFQRDLPENEGLQPFYYSNKLLFSTEPDPGKKDQHRNCKEWLAVTGKKVNEEDIFEVEYEVTPEAFCYGIQTGKWDSLQENTFVKWLKRDDNQHFRAYFVYAKKVESLMALNYDPWPDSEISSSMDRYDTLLQEGVKMTGISGSSFLKCRYAFQVEKLIYYKRFNFGGSDENPLVQWYEDHLGKKRTIVADWGMLYYALCLDSTNRDKVLINTFDRCDEKKVFVYQALTRKNLAKLRVVVKDKKTLSLIATIEALKTDGRALNKIEELYQLNPESKYLQMLVGREVNKLEDWIASPVVKGFTASAKVNRYQYSPRWSHNVESDTPYVAVNYKKDKQYLAEVRQYLESIVGNTNRSKAFLQLAVAHLYELEGNYTAAETTLAKLGRLKNKKMEAQRLIELAVAEMSIRDIRQPAIKNELNSIFSKLEKPGLNKEKENDEIGYDGSGSMLPNLYLLLSQKYKKAGDMVTASLLFRKADLLVNSFYGHSGYFSLDEDKDNYYGQIAYLDKFGSEEDVDALLRFKHKAHKTLFEKRINPPYWASDNCFLDLKGTILTRKGDFGGALKAMATIPDNYWNTTWAFKEYLGKTNVTSMSTLLPVESGNGRRYSFTSKREILKDIVALQKQLKRTTNRELKAEQYFELANAYYNMTYYGRDWMMFAYGKSYSEVYQQSDDWWWYSFRSNNRKCNNIYYRCQWAKEMYRKAFALTKNKELGAQCVLMLDLCDRNSFDGRQAGNDDAIPYKSKWLPILKTKFSSTEVYERASTECPDVGDWLKG